MANHRPKSLSELNNVYDKAMRAERAIRESSDLLSTPDTTPTPPSENIFEQLETKAAEAQKNQVFDPDITNIANDFLKRYAQPEKPKPAPKEIKRPAPSIQVYHTPVKEKEPEVPAELPVAEKAPSAPVYKPASVMTPTEAVQSAVVPEAVKEPEEVKAPAIVSAPIVKAPAAPEVTPKAPAVTKAPSAPKAPARVDHTPRPAARVRITSTERNELMEEYMRVMSDEDDEPSYKKPMFSFFKKKKKYDDEDDFDSAEDLYEDIDDTDEDSLEEEIPVVPFDNSQVQYEDEYSSSPEDGFITDDEIPQAPMNLYDYIEADFDYEAEAEEEIAEEIEEAEAEEIAEEITEEIAEEAIEELVAEEVTEEPTEAIEEAIAEEEEIIYPEEVEEAIEELPAEEAIEEIIPSEEEPQEAIYEEAPTAGMVFEDIFSVSDESKRSHTGGNWNEVFGEEAEEEAAYEPEAVIYPEEEAAEEVAEAIEESPAEDEAIEEIIPTEEASEEAEEATEEAEEDFTEEELTEEEEAEPYKNKLALKIIMSLAVVLCLAIAGISIFASAVLGVDTGKIFSDRYRAFSVPETIAELGISKGDLVITENIYASADQLYVYTEQSAYKIGKVTATTTNLLGDYLYITQVGDSIQLINRDTSLGVVTDTYSGIGSVLSAISEYGIYIAIASIVFAIALIICLAIIITKQRRYEAAAAIYDNPDNFRDDEDDNTPDSDNDNNDEYYSDYDTDGIEQGLFAEL